MVFSRPGRSEDLLCEKSPVFTMVQEGIDMIGATAGYQIGMAYEFAPNQTAECPHLSQTFCFTDEVEWALDLPTKVPWISQA
jgi:hypothetical protein